jgi:putative transposase
MVGSYSLRPKIVTPHFSQPSGMIERVIRTLKQQRTHRHRFETQQDVTGVIGEWIRLYNTRRSHQVLGIKKPSTTYGLAPQPVQKTAGHYITIKSTHV